MLQDSPDSNLVISLPSGCANKTSLHPDYGPRDSSVAQDLMGHITLQCMQKCRAALDDLSLEEHGIDGPRPQRARVLAGSWGLSK